MSELFDQNFEAILADYKRGASISDLADQYAISAPTITKWLKRTNNFVKRPKWAKKELSLSTRFSEIAHMYEEGVPVKDIAPLFDVTPPTIRNWLIQGGYKRKTKGRTPTAMKARAHDLASRGWPAEQIAQLFKEKESEVQRWLSEEAPSFRPRFQNPKTKPTKRYKAKRVKNPAGPKPARHKCKRRWTEQEIDYVWDMIQEGYRVKEIYQQTGASRARQNKILQIRGGGRPFVPRMPKAPKARPVPPRPRAAIEGEEYTVTQLPGAARRPGPGQDEEYTVTQLPGGSRRLGPGQGEGE